MIRTLLAMAVVAMSSSTLDSAPRVKDKKDDLPDEKRIQGTWRIELSEHNGMPRDGKTYWTFDGEKMTSKTDRAGGNESNWVIKLDTKNKHIDITSYPGIYVFKGEKLLIAYRLNAPRPTELKSDAQTYYCELVRVKD